jgi:hypothetical protein
VYGTPPFSRLSYAKFLVSTSPFLLVFLITLCGGVFSEREISTRNIVFSTPITTRGYFGLKSAAITGAFLLVASVLIATSFAFIGWQFRYFRFHEYLHPICVFLVPPLLFGFGLAMAAGRISGKLVYGILPALFAMGILNVDLPVWIDLCGNNFLTNLSKVVFRSLGTVEMHYFVPASFLMSRCLFVLIGVGLLILACRRIRS